MAETSEVVNTELQSVDEKDSKQQAEEKTVKKRGETILYNFILSTLFTNHFF